MGMNAATAKLLREKGLSFDDLIEVMEALEKKADPTNAQRQARYRAKRKNNTVTVTGVSPPIEDHTPPVSSDEETRPAPKAKPKTGPVAKPEGVNPAVWRDFNRQRKTPVTPTALDGISAQAELAGWTLNAALAEAVSRGWQSFKAEWVSKATGPPGRGSHPASFLESLVEKDRQHQQVSPA